MLHILILEPNLKHFSRLIHLLKQQNLEFLRTKLDAVWKLLVPSLTLSGLWNRAELFQGTLEVLIRNEWRHLGIFIAIFVVRSMDSKSIEKPVLYTVGL